MIAVNIISIVWLILTVLCSVLIIIFATDESIGWRGLFQQSTDSELIGIMKIFTILLIGSLIVIIINITRIVI